MSESDTPETDNHPSRWQHGRSAEYVHADHARDLERRLNDAREALVDLTNTLNQYGGGASMMHPRVTRALTKASKRTDKTNTERK